MKLATFASTLFTILNIVLIAQGVVIPTNRLSMSSSAKRGSSPLNDICGPDNGYSCAGGLCCSQYGYCGWGVEFCGFECHSEFGTCWTQVTQSQPAAAQQDACAPTTTTMYTQTNTTQITITTTLDVASSSAQTPSPEPPNEGMTTSFWRTHVSIPVPTGSQACILYGACPTTTAEVKRDAQQVSCTPDIIVLFENAVTTQTITATVTDPVAPPADTTVTNAPGTTLPVPPSTDCQACYAGGGEPAVCEKACSMATSGS